MLNRKNKNSIPSLSIGVQGQTFRGGDKSGKLHTSAKNPKVLNDLKMLRDG